MKRQETRTLFDLLVDIDLRQVTDKQLTKLCDDYDLGPAKNIYGFYVPSKNLIYIRKGMTHEEKLRTLFHELAHAYSHHIRECNGEGELDELQTETLGAKWHQTLYGVSTPKRTS